MESVIILLLGVGHSVAIWYVLRLRDTIKRLDYENNWMATMIVEAIQDEAKEAE